MLTSEMFPALFQGMTATQIDSLDQAVANAVLEGYEPTGERIALLTAEARGEITFDELVARTIAAASTGQAPVPAA